MNFLINDINYLQLCRMTVIINDYRCKVPVENAMRDANLSYKDLNEVILVGGSTRIPAVQELVKRITGRDPNVTVNPDEVVALGAAVQVCSLHLYHNLSSSDYSMLYLKPTA